MRCILAAVTQSVATLKMLIDPGFLLSAVIGCRVSSYDRRNVVVLSLVLGTYCCFQVHPASPRL